MSDLKKAEYDGLVSSKIGRKYSLAKENKILREALASNNFEEFNLYNDYVEQCKAEAHEEVYGNV